MEEKILEVNDLSVSFSGGVQAVSDVSFDLRRPSRTPSRWA